MGGRLGRSGPTRTGAGDRIDYGHGGTTLRVPMSLCLTLNELSHLIQRGIIVKCTGMSFTFDVVNLVEQETIQAGSVSMCRTYFRNKSVQAIYC